MTRPRKPPPAAPRLIRDHGGCGLFFAIPVFGLGIVFLVFIFLRLAGVV